MPRRRRGSRRWAAGVRLGAIAIALAALFAVVRATLRTRDTLGWILLATTTVAAVFGIHDWLAVRDPGDLRPMYLVPYVALLFIGFVGWMMIDRFVRTLRQYEALNIELESRVAEKSRALEIEAARQADLRHEAENANLSKSRFLAAASHDLRQPLHALGLFASALDERVKDPGGRELVGRINQSIGSLEALFDQVLDVSRLDAGAVTAEVRAVPLQPLFDRIANDLSSNAEEKDLALRFVPTSRVVRSDPHLLERILRNLVANAIRYTERGGIVVGVRPRAGRVAIEVRDSGIGIADEHRARVFEEFYQAGGGERDRRQGLGLGLSIVKRLCDAPGARPLVRVGAGARHDVPDPARAGAGAGRHAGGRFAAASGDIACGHPRRRDRRRAGRARQHGRAPSRLGLRGLRVRLGAGGARRERPPTRPRLRSWSWTTGWTPARSDSRRPSSFASAWGAGVPAVIISGESSGEELARIRQSGLPLLHKPVPPAKLKSLLMHLRAAGAGPALNGSRPP